MLTDTLTDTLSTHNEAVAEHRPYEGAIVVDGPNLYFGLKEEGRSIEYAALRSLVGEGGKAIYVSFTSPDPAKAQKHERFLHALRQGGWEVRMPLEPARWGREKGIDVLVAIALLEMALLAKTVYLVSGDGDLAPAVRAAKELGAKVVVLAPQGVIARTLAQEADEVQFL